jgi:Zn-dependent protease with chaperone function
MAESQPASLPPLQPLPYHKEVVRYLREHEPDVWRWARSAQAQSEHADAVRAELLKQTYRMDERGHPVLHAAARAAAERLGLQVPLTLYQATDGPMNATLFFVPGEAHIVFSGPLLERLQGPELEALLGHELSHYLLWAGEEGVYHAADRILSATSEDSRASGAHLQTARLYRLFTEAYADRGAVVACGALEPAVTALVKTHTGLTSVSAASYLQQADEVVSRAGWTADGASHPEVFVRARALRLWSHGDAEAETWLRTALRGPLAVEAADLTSQQELVQLTQRALLQIMRPAWMRTEATLAHARRFFPEFKASETADDMLATQIADLPACHDYFAALLLDLATADRDMEDAPLALALELGKLWGVSGSLEARAQRDLKIPKRQFNKLKQEAAALVERTAARHV